MRSIKERTKNEKRKRKRALTMNIFGMTVVATWDNRSASATLSPKMAVAKQRKSRMKKEYLVEVTTVLNFIIWAIPIIKQPKNSKKSTLLQPDNS